ncbi:MAG: methyltransferase, TIGR04325 family, partial [Candidatus Aureabacteria bacterium]|nr:methyltransferase, TIGR04325 family [Candidatus Auribacterota bacterium]
LHDSKGYDSPDIFTKLKTASLKVKSGEAVYERDSVLFDKIEYSWPLLAGLMWIASQKENTLSIIDYGGALGTTYFQNRLFLKALNELHWSIIEQKHLVEFGNKYFENESLRFFDDLDSCLAQMHAETILFSGVLQYLQNPYAILKQLLKEKITYILFDRTLFHETDKPDQLMIQKVSPAIYDASFPCWFFNLSKFLSFFSKDYDLIADFPGFQEGKGFIFKKKNS